MFEVERTTQNFADGEVEMSDKQTYRGSCHCKSVRYEAGFDLQKGTNRCNCSICWKARAWFVIVVARDFRLLTSPGQMGEYRWIPEGKSEPFLTYRFCKHCGIRIYAAGEQESLGGEFYAVNVPTLDDVDMDALAAAPLTFNDNLHGRARGHSASLKNARLRAIRTELQD